jgi:tetratricopeptide (TPR) repeat protein
MTPEFQKNLPDDLYNSLLDLCKEGDRLLSQRNFDGTVIFYKKALRLIPDPAERWNATAWLYVTLAESFFLNSQFEEAEMMFSKVCAAEPSGKTSPLVHLRLAQSLYKLGKTSDAERELRYALTPYDISEMDDPVYRDLIREQTIRDDSRLPNN